MVSLTLNDFIWEESRARYQTEHKRVTLTDPHVRDATRGGSVNEGRMVRPPEAHAAIQMMMRIRFGLQQRVSTF